MTQKNPIDEMTKELHALAFFDNQMATENGIDLNPFSTEGSRHLWIQGWNGERPANLVDGSGNWRYWERGRLAQVIAGEPRLAWNRLYAQHMVKRTSCRIEDALKDAETANDAYAGNITPADAVDKEISSWRDDTLFSETKLN